MTNASTPTSKLFRSFRLISATGHRSVIRFVEDHLADIHELPVREYFELRYWHLAALYEVGDYQAVLDVSTELLELSILEDIRTVEEEDAYRTVLFRRASALYKSAQYAAAAQLCEQIVRLYPQFRAAALLYERALYQQPNPRVRMGRAACIVLFLSAAALTALELLVVDYFFEQHLSFVVLLRNVVFALGWLLMLVGDVGYRAYAWLRVRTTVMAATRRRAARSDG